MKARQQVHEEAFRRLTDFVPSAEDTAFIDAIVDRFIKLIRAEQAAKAKMN